jgi:hypothetical protein
LYTSDNEIIYLDLSSGIAIDLKQDKDYINGNACWKLFYENDLQYSQDWNKVTISALDIDQSVPFVLRPKCSGT